MIKQVMLSTLISISCVVANAKDQSNIVSVLVGQGPTSVKDYSTQGSSSGSPYTNTTTTTKTDSGQGNSAGNGFHTTTTTDSGSANSFIPGVETTQMNQGAVVGLQYQHRLNNGPVWMGVLIQSNQTTSFSVGFGF